MARRVALLNALTKLDPPIDDPESALAEHRVMVDGAIVTNPSSQVLPSARIVVKPSKNLQGVRKMTAALDRFGLSVDGAVGLDLGACTGGFTQVLLDRGAARVYAVDVGYGQLLGSLRQDERVVSLERTNVAEVTPALLGERPTVIVCDVTKVSLRQVGAQLVANDVPAPGAHFVGLVKPMFELGTGELPEGDDLDRALTLALDGLADAGWEPLDSMVSPVVGHRGAIEFFVLVRRPA
ncbi:MAG: SAM-dependent methyltransferase [Actinomycetota bacterium]